MNLPVKKRNWAGKSSGNHPNIEKFLEYKSLKKSERIKDYFAFKLSRDYVNFTLLIGSEKIASFEQLEKYVRSDEFKKVKEYMMLPGQEKTGNVRGIQDGTAIYRN